VVEEVMPQVEQAYNVTRDRTQRAIAGLSMGGAEATFVGLNHLDKFAWIGSFSGAYVMWPGARGARGAAAPGAAPAAGRGGPSTIDAAAMPKNFPALDAKANSQIRLLWVACGTADGLVGVNRQFRDWLNTKDVKFTYIEIPEIAHVWPLWRQNLTDLAPLLFQDKAR
jgi:enterochelin esterase family protein